MQYFTPIPNVSFPNIKEFPLCAVEEELVSLSKSGYTCFPYYYQTGVFGAIPDCYVRESVVKLLDKARKLLPEPLDFLVYDGYRPIAVQQRLWDFQSRLKC